MIYIHTKTEGLKLKAINACFKPSALFNYSIIYLLNYIIFT